MDFADITFRGPTPDDMGLLEALPNEIVVVLHEINGFLAYRGAFHFRGVASVPLWHSLAAAWHGDQAIHKLYSAVSESHIPFGQNCLGDQFLWREDVVFELCGETGELTSLGMDLEDFLKSISKQPDALLPMELLQQFESNGFRLQPGQLLNVYPPLCTSEASAGVSLRAVPAAEEILFLADFAEQIQSLPDGSRVEIRVERSK